MESAPQTPTTAAAGDVLRVADLPGRGRGLVAARNVREGEVLLFEPHVLPYPSTLSSLASYCSACFHSLPAAATIPCASCRAAAFCSPACAAASYSCLICAAAVRGAALAAAAPTEAIQEPLLFPLSAYSLPKPTLGSILSLSSAPPPPPGAQDAAGLQAAVSALAPANMLPQGFSPDLLPAPILCCRPPPRAAASHSRLICAALSHAAAAPTEAIQEPLLFPLSAYSLRKPTLGSIFSLSSAPPPPPGAQDAAGLHAAVSALAPANMLPQGFSPDLLPAAVSDSPIPCCRPPPRAAMRMVAGAKRRRLEEGEDGERLQAQDRISSLPDGVLGDIISLLPTTDGARTQVLSSRWRPLWRSSPLNLELGTVDVPGQPAADERLTRGEISRILSSHEGSGRRLSVHMQSFLDRLNSFSASLRLEDWLQSPALEKLQELGFHYGSSKKEIPLPPSVRCFSSTLRVATFGGCGGFPDASGERLHLPVLAQLSLLDVTISDTSLNSLLASCPALQSLLLSHIIGCSRAQIVSPTLRSLCVRVPSVLHIILEDAPSLERLLLFPHQCFLQNSTETVIKVISAPKLHFLGLFSSDRPQLQFVESTVFQGSSLVSSMTVVPSVKILALVNMHLDLGMVINIMRCFPCLENLHIETTTKSGEKNLWRKKYRNPVIPLKKIVLLKYRGNKSHVSFATFFVLNASLLESMVFEVEDGKGLGSEWIEKQHKRLQIEKKASGIAQFDFVKHAGHMPLHQLGYVLAHDMSTSDPFASFDKWS